ncbi:MAG: hypothetical protein LDLANPLL_00910 [Turneriella sp.]|nr:hypothetical protein [Turneriella sp.]
MQNTPYEKNLTEHLGLNSQHALSGFSGVTPYASEWRATEFIPELYPLRPVLDLRASIDIMKIQNFTVEAFASVSGIIPLSTAYQDGIYQVHEKNTCVSVDYTNCPLAALNFVDTSGAGTYAAQLNSNLYSTSLVGGVTFFHPIGIGLEGLWSYGGDLGIVAQTFLQSATFVASRCADGSSTPCAQENQVRVVQGELKTTAAYSFGPLVGLTLRYERENSWWFAEFGTTVVFLFSRWENSGYTNFVAAGTQAFTQSAHEMGVVDAVNTFAVLPRFVLRAGVRL